MIRLLIVDDHEVMRLGLSLMMAPEHDLQVIATASGGAEGVAIAARDRPDLVLMDLRMPGMDGLEATRQIVARAPTVKVVILTGYDEFSVMGQALDAGAATYVSKTASVPALLKTIRELFPDETLSRVVQGPS